MRIRRSEAAQGLEWLVTVTLTGGLDGSTLVGGRQTMIGIVGHPGQGGTRRWLALHGGPLPLLLFLAIPATAGPKTGRAPLLFRLNTTECVIAASFPGKRVGVSVDATAGFETTCALRDRGPHTCLIDNADGGRVRIDFAHALPGRSGAVELFGAPTSEDKVILSDGAFSWLSTSVSVDRGGALQKHCVGLVTSLGARDFGGEPGLKSGPSPNPPGPLDSRVDDKPPRIQLEAP